MNLLEQLKTFDISSLPHGEVICYPQIKPAEKEISLRNRKTNEVRSWKSHQDAEKSIGTCGVWRVVSGRDRYCGDWILASTTLEEFYADTQFELQHIETGEVKKCYDNTDAMCKLKCSRTSVDYLLKGKMKTLKGWKLKKQQ